MTRLRLSQTLSKISKEIPNPINEELVVRKEPPESAGLLIK